MEKKEHIHYDQFAKNSGIKLVEAKNGEAIAKMEIRNMHLNGLNLVHGGALFTLADFTLGAAVNSLGGAHVTMSASIHYVKSAKEGTLIGISKQVSAGRTIATYDVEIRLEATNDLIAIVRGNSFKKS